ncbi:hypothetical protein [Nakamurella lactea]|uniref:hypothetical protein n=1 Tax=Nakamurella lactea TaxID=459515 RepID=UPI0012B5504C|nr:hypothetical protein [Nakamurella lactea]
MLVDTVAMLRDRGYGANASNRFDQALDDYDLREVDLVLLGGMVPAETKEWLRGQIPTVNPQISLLQGLGGLPPLLVAQVEQFFRGTADGIEYDPGSRVLRLTLFEACPVTVEGVWAEIVPPEPIVRSMALVDAELAPGVHEIAVPDVVPLEGSFVTVRIDDRASALQIGETPAVVRRFAANQSLPAPTPVTTHLPWE